MSLRRYIQEQGSADRDFSCISHWSDVTNILCGQQTTAGVLAHWQSSCFPTSPHRICDIGFTMHSYRSKETVNLTLRRCLISARPLDVWRQYSRTSIANEISYQGERLLISKIPITCGFVVDRAVIMP
jgi:hypothetical protein